MLEVAVPRQLVDGTFKTRHALKIVVRLRVVHLIEVTLISVEQGHCQLT
jgi:hypothetical protein